MKKHKVILGLGSNIGDRAAHLRAAIFALSNYMENIKESQIFESQALLPENAPNSWDLPFYNMAISGQCSLLPREFLAVIKQIEQDLGRNKIGHWSPREIDIDILAMDDLVLNEPDLIIPHSELLKRDFALVPLSEIEPDWVHPVVGKTARELLKNE